MSFPEIKIKLTDIDRAKKLKKDLSRLENDILEYTPKNIDKRKLQRIKIRIFPFPKEEDANEYYFTHRKAKYVCLNAKLLHRRYYAALQFTLHGIAHSFCYLRNGITEEAFCEYVGYSLLERFARKKGEKLSRKVIRSTMKATSKEYNNYFRAARKLDERDPGFLLKLNTGAKNKKISRKREKRVIARYLKVKKYFIDENENFKAPNLGKGFKII